MATVLLAEDDDAVRELLEFMLTGAGHTVLSCGDGDAALRLALARHPDVAVLDVSMPGRSGLEVCAAMRAEPATARTPVLLVTARGTHGDVADGLRAGATDYVVKPFGAGDLLARVDALTGWDRLGNARPHSARA
ncbi:response regulator [Dactylosporangium sp. NPDC051485]|uniref:response regulator transcription factor n=1 Tax=Dactylosporangium sp. NPDC051485 TaxID=3154846 RepID=UPI00341BCF0B